MAIDLSVIWHDIYPPMCTCQVQDRAAMLGHNVETNLKYYTKTTGDYVEELLKLEEAE